MNAGRVGLGTVGSQGPRGHSGGRWRQATRRRALQRRQWAPVGVRAEGSALDTPTTRSREETTPASKETSCQKSRGDVGKCGVMETTEQACPLVLEEAAVEASGSTAGREWEARGHLSSSSDALQQGDFSKLHGSRSIRQRLSGRFKDSGGNQPRPHISGSGRERGGRLLGAALRTWGARTWGCRHLGRAWEEA